MRAVPNVEEDGVREHADKYDRYLEWVDEKKQGLAQYKEAKKRKEKERIARVDS